MKENFDVILLAAGKGERFKSEIPKQFIEVKNNLTIIEMSFNTLSKFTKRIIITKPLNQDFPVDIYNRLQEQSQKENIEIIFCEGGFDRQNSVEKALEFVKAKYILIHDAARPLISERDLLRLTNSVIEKQACVLASKITDTLKEVKENSQIIEKTIDRNKIWAVQTPQGFNTQKFKQALKFANEKKIRATDDSFIMEFAGEEVYILENKDPNFKITEQKDFMMLLALITEKP